MKKTLLSTSALVGAAMIAAPAYAGTVGSKDTYDLSLSGRIWFNVAFSDEDISAGQGRGYNFYIGESELFFDASATADNGLKYGASIEINAGAADNSNADEAWMFVDSDVWGRIEAGDQDDAINRMQVTAAQAHKGLGGPSGGLGAILTLWESFGGDNLIARSDWTQNTVSDDTKLTYFSPRFGGFQVGASLTPDSGAISGTGGLTEADNDGDFENTIGVAANWVGNFDEVGLRFSAAYEAGDDESTSGSDAAQEDLEIWGVGGRVDFAGFTLAADYYDVADTNLTTAATTAGADGGDRWAVALGYQAGPWGVSTWYADGERTSAVGVNTELTRLGFGAGYTVAPGWLLRADLEFMDHENPNGTTTDNDGTGFMLTNLFIF